MPSTAAYTGTPNSHCRRKKAPKADAYLHEVKDRKLKGQLRHRERVYQEGTKRAAKAAEWLLPADGGFLEAEGEHLALLQSQKLRRPWPRCREPCAHPVLPASVSHMRRH